MSVGGRSLRVKGVGSVRIGGLEQRRSWQSHNGTPVLGPASQERVAEVTKAWLESKGIKVGPGVDLKMK